MKKISDNTIQPASQHPHPSNPRIVTWTPQGLGGLRRETFTQQQQQQEQQQR